MTLTVFVTGTDTGAGKTHAACALIRAFAARGLRVCGFKPVASGCLRTSAGLRSEDALALQAAAGTDEPHERIAPYAFEPAVAPHIAAAKQGLHIDPERLDAAHAALAPHYDVIVAEGAGGWLLPLDDVHTLADWVAWRHWPVVLVVGLRLGCLNHALLTAEAVRARTRLAGWAGNLIPPVMPEVEANLRYLRRHLQTPELGVLPPAAEPPGAGALSVEALLTCSR